MHQKEDTLIKSRLHRPLVVNLIGAGRIGLPVIKHILKNDDLVLGAVLALQQSDIPEVAFMSDPDPFFARAADVIIDAAGPGALIAYGERALARAPLWSISASAMADRAVDERLTKAASDSGHALRFLSGAIAGLDGVAAAACDPDAMISVHIERPGITDDVGETFEGNAREVARLFPHEANVAAAVALAGCGMDRTNIKLVSGGPGTAHVLHVTARSCFGQMTASMTIAPLSTGHLHPVSASIIAALKQASGVVRLG